MWRQIHVSPLLVLMLVLPACSGLIVAPTYSSKSVTNPHPCVAVMGDVQRTSILEVWRERNDAEREALIRQLAAEKPDALMLLGDQVFWGNDNDDWAYFDAAMLPVRRLGVPVYPILGNHEYFWNVDRMLRQVSVRFPGLDESPRTVIIDSVAWVLINTNIRDIGARRMEEQRKWFVKAIRQLETSSSVLYINVCGHHPPFTNSTVVGDDELLQSFFVAPFIESRKGAFWFSGHCHAYEHFSYGGKHFIVSGGGGGPRQRLFQGALADHEDLYPGDIVRPFHYCLVSRDPKGLKLLMRPLHGYEDRADSIFTDLTW